MAVAPLAGCPGSADHIANYRDKIRERAIEKAKARIILHGRKVEDMSEDELEVIVAEEEEKIRTKIHERLIWAPVTAIALLFGISG